MDPNSSNASSSHHSPNSEQSKSPAETEVSPLSHLEKLTKEYQRIKTQNSILKKAVIQEQQKNQKLELELKEKEIRIRAIEEEIDILQFNNASLQKRIVSLQNSLQEATLTNSSSGWFSSRAKQELAKKNEELGVLKEELQHKIRENEDLHIQISEHKKATQSTVEILQGKIQKLKAELKKKKDELEDSKNQHKQIEQKLTEANETLNAKVEELADSLVRTKQLMQEHELAMTKIQQKLTADLESSQALIKRKIPFDDTKIDVFNALNVPTFDKTFEIRKQEILQNSDDALKNWFKTLKEIDSRHSERLLLVNKHNSEMRDELRHLNQKIGDLIVEHHKVVDILANSFESVLDKQKQHIQINPDDIKQLIDSATAFVNSHRTFVSLEQLRLEEESKRPNITSEMKSIIGRISSSYATLHSVFESLHQSLVTAFSLLFIKNVEGATLSSSLKQLQTSLETLIAVLKDLTIHYSAKINEEHKDAVIVPEFKQINERLLTSFSSLISLTDKLKVVIGQFGELVIFPLKSFVRGALPKYEHGFNEISELRKRGQKFMQTIIELPQSISIPYEEQLRHIDTISKLNQERKQQELLIESIKDEIAKVKKEKENLLLELARVKDTAASQQSQLHERLTELIQLKQANSQYIEEIGKLKQKVQQLQHQLQQTLDQSQRLQQHNKELQEQLKNIQQQQQQHQQPPSVPTAQQPQSPQPPQIPDSTSVPTNTSPQDSQAVPLENQPYSQLQQQPEIETNTKVSISPQPPRAELLLLDDFFATATPLQSSTSARQIETKENAASTSVDLLSDSVSSSASLSRLSSSMASTNETKNLRNQDISSQDTNTQETRDGNSKKENVAEVPSREETNSTKKWNLIVIDATGQMSNSLGLSKEDKEREEQLKQYYDEKYNQLTKQLQLADTKAMELFKAKQQLEEQLQTVLKEKESLEKQNRTFADELETTRKNYETQLNVMTEHVVQLNDKLSQYEAELSSLKACKVKCGKCKQWNTIGWLLTEGKNGAKCSGGNHPSSFNFS